MRCKLFATLVLFLAFAMNALGQKITGIILDASTGDSLALAGVTYKERKVSTIADLDGKFTINRINGATLTFSCMGYKDESVNVTKATPSRLTIKLKPDMKSLQEVVIKAERKRYVRKDNPAVELMKRVIDAKKESRLENHDFYMYNKYQKLSMSLNDFKIKEGADSIEEGKVKFRQMAELSPYNGKMVCTLQFYSLAFHEVLDIFRKKIVLLLRFFNSSIHIQNEEDNFTFYGFADDYNGSSRPCFKGKCNARLQEFPDL